MHQAIATCCAEPRFHKARSLFTSHLALTVPPLNSRRQSATRVSVSYEFNDPQCWFDRAEEMRPRSDLMRDPGNREIMLRIAADYERAGGACCHPSKTNARRASTSIGGLGRAYVAMPPNHRGGHSPFRRRIIFGVHYHSLFPLRTPATSIFTTR